MWEVLLTIPNWHTTCTCGGIWLLDWTAEPDGPDGMNQNYNLYTQNKTNVRQKCLLLQTTFCHSIFLLAYGNVFPMAGTWHPFESTVTVFRILNSKCSVIFMSICYRFKVENFISPIIMAHLLLVRLWRKILSWDQKGSKAGLKCAPIALFPGHMGGEEALPFPLGLGVVWRLGPIWSSVLQSH